LSATLDKFRDIGIGEFPTDASQAASDVDKANFTASHKLSQRSK
jgi:hypothetical protein